MRHEDRGAALVVAIAFVVAIGAVCGGLAALTASSLSNRAPLEAARNREFAADGGIQYAIAQVRTIDLPPLTACNSAGGTFAPTAGPAMNLNGIPIRVDWVNACGAVVGADGAVVVQRNVIFTACVAVATSCASPASVIIRAQVNFEQGLTGGVTNTYVQTWSVNG
ncbi:MAG: hypothetical protein ABIR68_08345 [Ilumatobacteraceae bacterium]